MVAVSAFFIYSEYSRAIIGTLAAARDAERLVSYIGECISYRSDTVGEIIGSYKGVSPQARRVWEAASSASLSEALSLDSLPFDEETHRLLSEFALSLGRGYREPQAELCRVYSRRIGEHARSLESSKKDRLRVGVAVCAFACLSLIILFI